MSSNIHLPMIAASFVAALVISVAIHELGHVIAGRLAGVRVVACGIGYRPWLHARVGGIVFYFGWPFFSGLTLSLEDDLHLRRGPYAVMIAGGPLANLFAFFGTGWLWYGHYLLWLAPELCIANGLLALASLVPFSARTKTATFRNDALFFLQLCVGTTHKWGDGGMSLATMLFLRDLFRRLNFLPGVMQTTAGAALFYTLLDDGEQAASLLSDEALVGSNRVPEAIVWEGVARAVTASANEAADFHDILTAARRACPGKPAATISLALLEADWQHRHGFDASSLVEEAVQASQQVGLPAQEAAAESLLLQIRAPDDMADKCRSLLARRGARCLSQEGALELLTVAARLCAERGDDRGAQQFFAKAVERIQQIAAHIPTPATRARFLRSRGKALRAAAIAGDGVPAFLSESESPKPSRVNLGLVGLFTFASGLAVGAIIFVIRGRMAGRLGEASSLAVAPMVMLGLVGCIFCLLALLQPFTSRRLGLYGLVCNLILILAPGFLVAQLGFHDLDADTRGSSLDDVLGASAIHNLRELARLQFKEGRTEDATLTCRRVIDLGGDVHPPSRARAGALFSFAVLLYEQSEFADAQAVCRQAIAAAGESNANPPVAYRKLLDRITSKAERTTEQTTVVQP